MSNMKDVISIFAENKKIGVVIPDIPDYFKFISAFDVLSKENRELCNELWSKMFSDRVTNSVSFMLMVSDGVFC